VTPNKVLNSLSGGFAGSLRRRELSLSGANRRFFTFIPQRKKHGMPLRKRARFVVPHRSDMLIEMIERAIGLFARRFHCQAGAKSFRSPQERQFFSGVRLAAKALNRLSRAGKAQNGRLVMDTDHGLIFLGQRRRNLRELDLSLAIHVRTKLALRIDVKQRTVFFPFEVASTKLADLGRLRQFTELFHGIGQLRRSCFIATFVDVLRDHI
jgi:hypothetical protein